MEYLIGIAIGLLGLKIVLYIYQLRLLSLIGKAERGQK
jgi:hypothetical protein